MTEVLPAHAILSVMRDLAEQAADAPMEALSLALVHLLEDPRLQNDDDLFGQFILLGAGLWRHTEEFKAGNSPRLQ